MSCKRSKDIKKNGFLTCSSRFLRSNKLEQLEFKLGNFLGFRNLQEKLEKAVCFDLTLGEKPLWSAEVRNFLSHKVKPK